MVYADTGIEVLFWLVIALVWGIAQLVRRFSESASGRQKNGREETKETAPLPHSPGKRELQDFFERVEEQQTRGRRSRSTPRPPPVSGEPGAAMRRQREAMRPAKALTERAERRSKIARLKTTSKMKARRHTVVQRHTPSIYGRAMKTAGMKQPMSAVNYSTHSRASRIGASWDNRERLRRAMLSHIILGRPKSMYPDGGTAPPGLQHH